MKERLYRFMAGRYGADHFSRFLSIAAMVLLVLSVFLRVFKLNLVSDALWFLAIAMMAFQLFRIFSKNTVKRRAELNKYFAVKAKITGFINQIKTRIKQSKTHCFFKCPQCGVTVRIPRGKGKIKITCPKCGNAFIKIS